MRGFDEAWLREYEGKRTAARPFDGPIQFTLPRPYMLLNGQLRLHPAVRSAHARRLSGQIAKLTTQFAGRAPLERALVEIERHSTQEPDRDGLIGGAKPLLDCLIVRRLPSHPNGLGFILDDNPGCLEWTIQHVKSPTLKGQCTVVRIGPRP